MVKAFLGFMDHSISEQLTGNPSAWHTTAMVMSEGAGCGTLASAIAARCSRSRTRLRKWNGTKQGSYRDQFADALADNLPSSGVSILASSATEEVIRRNERLIIRDLGLDSLYTTSASGGGRLTSRIGPFVRRDTHEDHWFEMPEKQAIMVLWVAHFVGRMHSLMAGQFRKSGVDLFSLDWLPLYIDRFPGQYANSTSLFQTLVSDLSYRDGNIRVAYFTASPAHESIFADNVAGLFNGWRMQPRSDTPEADILRTGSIYYETA